MKRLSIVALLFMSMLAAGQITHGPEPPEGWFCTPDKEAPADHQCSCQRSCSPKLDCDEEGNCTPSPEGGMEVHEDAQCKVYCHKDHCGCPVKGCQST